MKYSSGLPILGLFLLMINPVTAQNAKPLIEDLSWISQSFLAKQRIRIDEIARLRTGAPIRGNKSDISTLQRLVDKEFIKQDDKESLQAMGVVLGDIFVKENKVLEWKKLTDKLGSSHAVCVKDSTNCIFPITMLSRRIEVGLKPNVKSVYDKTLKQIAPFFPKRPFQN